MKLYEVTSSTHRPPNRHEIAKGAIANMQNEPGRAERMKVKAKVNDLLSTSRFSNIATVTTPRNHPEVKVWIPQRDETEARSVFDFLSQAEGATKEKTENTLRIDGVLVMVQVNRNQVRPLS